MKASEARLLELMDQSPQFRIPIYQHTYSWRRAGPVGDVRFAGDPEERINLAFPDFEPSPEQQAARERLTATMEGVIATRLQPLPAAD